jgi:DHA3 family macrolide efflux protein-like MFS transporter
MTKRIQGFKGFLVIWFGQFASIFGSGMTSFTLTLWVFQETGSPTALALSVFFGTLPMLVFGPLSGVLVDRWSRKSLLIASDSLAGLATMGLLVVYLRGEMVLWHIYLVIFIAGVADSLQVPAFMGSITMLVPKKHYGRASGLYDLAATAASIFSPIAAAGLLAFTDLKDILLFDLCTFGLAILTLILVDIPQPVESDLGRQSKRSFRKDIAFGFKFILNRPSLRGLQSIWMVANLIGTATNVLIAAMILARTGGDEWVLSGVQAMLSAGAVIGGVLISIWGGPKRKVQGALLCMGLSAIFGRILFGFGRDFVTWIPGALGMFLFIPILNATLDSFWLAKVPPDVQGRVMSVRITASRSMIPLGTLIAGPLAEKIFEPSMMPDGVLAPILGNVLGTGPGVGMSLMFILMGILMLGLTAIGFTIPAIRDAEHLLPDIDVVAITD